MYIAKMNNGELYRHIGAVIKQRRKKLELTQEKLAAQLATSRASLANVEIGRQNIMVHQLYNFAKALDLTIYDLLPTELLQKEQHSDAALPLPKNLSAKQKEQITNLLNEMSPAVAPAKEEINGKQ